MSYLSHEQRSNSMHAINVVLFFVIYLLVWIIVSYCARKVGIITATMRAHIGKDTQYNATQKDVGQEKVPFMLHNIE